MAKMIYDEESFIDSNIFQYEDRIHSPAVRLQSKSMIIGTYYHLNTDESTADAGFQDVLDYVSKKSPLRFNKIENFPFHEMEQINVQLEDDERGLQFGHEGEFTILPGMIKPVPNSYFYLNHLGPEYLFRVTGINVDNLMRDNYYKVSYRLEYINDARTDQINTQVVETYVCIIDNIGTENNCLIEKKTLTKINDVKIMVEKIKELYISVFYNERYNCFLGEKGAGEYLYDPLQSIFVNETGVFNSKRDLKTIMLSVEYHDPRFKLKYEKSVYKFIKEPDIAKLGHFYYTTFPGTSKPETNFARWLDASIQIVDIPTYMDPTKKIPIFSDSFIESVDNNFQMESPYAELLRKYILNKGEIEIDDIPLTLYEEIISLDANLEVFFIMPLILYVIQAIIDRNTKLKI